jgi:hypothetical protein
MDTRATVVIVTGLAGLAGMVMTAAWLDAMRRNARRDSRAIHAEIRLLVARLDDRSGHARVTLPPSNLPNSTLRLPARVNGIHAP